MSLRANLNKGILKTAVVEADENTVDVRKAAALSVFYESSEGAKLVSMST